MSPSEESLEYRDRSVGYNALANPRRRYVLRLLDEADSSLSLQDLAAEIVRWEQDDPDQDVDEERMEEVHTVLHHVHAPKLDDAGFVKYDRDEERVTLTELAPLEFIERMEQ